MTLQFYSPYCKIDECDRPVENRDTGLCATHNKEVRKSEAPKPIKTRAKVKTVSTKQAALNREYTRAIFEIDRDRPKICEGCGRPQGGVIQLSHSHLISRDYCKDYNRWDLIVDPHNIKLHCKDWMGHIGCHTKWESNGLRPDMMTYEIDMAYVRSEIPQVYEIMKLNEYEVRKHYK